VFFEFKELFFSSNFHENEQRLHALRRTRDSIYGNGLRKKTSTQRLLAKGNREPKIPRKIE
jgi:hypothetical protein